jgi:hypothetical protein
MMNYNYKYEEFDTKGCFQGIGVLLLIVFFVGVTVFSAQETWVTDEAAKAYIQEMTGARHVEIVNDDGNSNMFIHEMSDVTFDVWLYFHDGTRRRSQFRCTDGYGYSIICRGYDGE